MLLFLGIYVRGYWESYTLRKQYFIPSEVLPANMPRFFLVKRPIVAVICQLQTYRLSSVNKSRLDSGGNLGSMDG